MNLKRRLQHITGAGTALVLGASLITLASPSFGTPETPANAPASDTDKDGDLDATSTAASVKAAIAAQERVEDFSQRTGSVSVYANPDGTFTQRDFGGTVRIERSGDWAPVDYTLTKQSDGTYVPKASDVDVTIDGGSAKEAARVTREDGTSLAFTWPTNLPEPTIDGEVATYKVSEASDLVVTVTGSGVTAHIRLNEQPDEDDPVFRLGLRADGVDVDQNSTGALTIANEDGKTVATTTQLSAWDAKTDAGGDPSNVVDLDAELNTASTSGDITQHTLDLTAPDGFLSDPSTVYPVIIDPDISMEKTRDTWVRKDTTAKGSTSQLFVGKQNTAETTNTNPARAYLKFYNSTIEKNANVEIVSAELGLFQYYAYTCADRRMYVYPVTQNWNDTITWDGKPPVVTGNGATNVETNRGASGCGAGWTKINLTAMAKAWNAGSVDMQGVRLSVDNETASSYERRFCSMDASGSTSTSTCTTARRPYLDVTYNTKAQMALLAAAIVRVQAGTGTAADKALIINSGYGDFVIDGSEPPEIVGVDEDDLIPEFEYLPAEPAAVDGDTSGCAPAVDATCVETTTTEDEAGEEFPDESDGEGGEVDPEGPGDILPAGTTLGKCADGHKARRYTAERINRSLTRTVRYKWYHYVHYCTKSGKVTKWRGTYDQTKNSDSHITVKELVVNVKSASGGKSAWSKMQRHLSSRIALPLMPDLTAEYYPWTKVTVTGKGGKSAVGANH